VNTGEVQLSLSDGSLEIANLQMADPDQLDRDRLRVGYVTARLSPGPLLRGQLHVQQLLLEDVQADVARQSRARPVGLRVPSLDGLAESPFGPGLGNPDLELDDYLGDWEKIHDRLHRLQEAMEKIEDLARTHLGDVIDEDPSARAESNPGFMAMRSMRCDFGRPRPAVLIEHVAARRLSEQFGLGSHGQIELTNLSSAPRMTAQPTRLAIAAPEYKLELLAQLNLHQPGSRHDLRFQASDVNLAELVRPRGPRPALALQGGLLTLSGTGWGDSRQFELSLDAQTQHLNVQVAADRRLAGLPPELWNQGLSRLGQLQASAVLYGRWTEPRLKIDTDQLVQHYKQQLRAAGEHLLVTAIEEQVARGEKLLARAIEKPLERIEQAVDTNVQRVEQTVDRQVAKVEQTVDHTVAKANGLADRTAEQAEAVFSRGEGHLAAAEQRVGVAAGRVDAVADQAQEQVQRAQQRYEDTAGRLQANVAETQARIAGAQRIFGENAQNPLSAAQEALRRAVPSAPAGGRYQSWSPDPAVKTPSAASTDSIAASPSTAPHFAAGAAAQQAATAATSSDVARPAPGDLMYPDSLRSVGLAPRAPGQTSQQHPPAAAEAVKVATAPSTDTPLPARTESVRPQSGPAPIGMELGYDRRRTPPPPGTSQGVAPASATQVVAAPAYPMTATPNANPPQLPERPMASIPLGGAALPRATTASPAISRSQYSAAAVAQGSAAMAAPPAMIAPLDSRPAADARGRVEATTQRLGDWSRGVAGKVKDFVPWGRSDEGPQVLASDLPATGAAPSDPHPGMSTPAVAQNPAYAPSRPAVSPPAAGQPQDPDRWYQRLWR
jgi:hypothetical protein